jgi:hypothetical protein
MDGHHSGINKRDLEWVWPARGVDSFDPLIAIENYPGPPFGVEVRKKCEGHELAASEMVIGEAFKIETEGAIAVDDEHRTLQTEQSPVPGERKTAGRTHQLVFKRQRDLCSTERHFGDRLGHVLGQMGDVDDDSCGSGRSGQSQR